jgi:hypothetical protein
MIDRFVPGLRRRADGRRVRAVSARARENLRRSVDRWAEKTSARASANPAIGLVGLDVSRPPARLRGSSWLPLVVTLVIAAMFLAVLRMDVIRMRLALAQAFEDELRLEEEKRELTVEMRQLRDPAQLARHAERLGFRRAEHLIDLAPEASAPEPSRAGASRPGSAAARPVELATTEGTRPGARP